MTDFFDTGDDDERVLVALQGIVREAGLDPYLDIRVPDAGSRVGGRKGPRPRGNVTRNFPSAISSRRVFA